MRVKMQWLRDYLDSKETMDITQVSKALNAAGLEVEEINNIASKINNVFIATIEELNTDSQNQQQLTCIASIDEKKYSLTIPFIKASLKDKIALIIENNQAKACFWKLSPSPCKPSSARIVHIALHDFVFQKDRKLFGSSKVSSLNKAGNPPCGESLLPSRETHSSCTAHHTLS